MARRNSSEPPPHAPIQGERPHAKDVTFEKGLPCSLDTERFVLGSILLNDKHFPNVSAVLSIDDLSLEKHRRIYARMKDLYERREAIDRVTVAEELIKQGQLESTDGLSYLTSLDEGLPDIPHIDSYLRILKDKSALRQLIFKSQRIIDQCMHAQEEPAIIAGAMEQFARKIVQARTKSDDGRRPEQVVTDFPGGIGAFLDPSKRLRGLQTGFTRLDEITAGFSGGQLIVIAASTGVGKSALAMNMAENFLYDEHPGSVFSLEMSAASLLDRMMCGRARVDGTKFRHGFINKDERSALQRALAWLAEQPLFLYDEGSLSLERIMKSLRRDVEERGVKWAVIDYLQLMSARGSFQNKNAEVSFITRELKLLSMELGIPIILLSQLNRSGEQKGGGTREPQVSDLRDSGSIGQDADLILLIWREWLTKRDREDLMGLADIIIGKQRNGAVGRIKLRFISSYARFENKSDDTPSEDNS